jgi:CRISPR-associated protein Cmr5
MSGHPVTRAQRDLALAERLVSEVEAEREEVRRIYGGLCHSFPVLVRSCGLCQALAYSRAKATAGNDSPRARAHAILLQHAGILLEAPDDPLARVREADVVDTMLATRRILAAWIYFKRFAVSILKQEDARSGQEAAGDAE